MHIKNNISLNDKKAAQMAYYFLNKTKSKRMPYLKLIKLMYIAERESLLRWGIPMLGDNLVAMPKGPVLSTVLDYIKGKYTPSKWSKAIQTNKDDYEVFAKENIDSDELSKAEVELLDEIWGKFGEMSQWKLKDWTHLNCKEWKDPKGSSIPIKYEDILKAGGFNDVKAKEIADEIKSFKKVDEIFSNL